jgi:small subunit ribosomal protein S11
MGKKRVIKPNQEELLKEKDKIEAGVKKDQKTNSSAGVLEGKVYIFSSYNNTIITLTNNKGDVLKWSSAGLIGFKGTKKSTPFAASKVSEAICLTAQKLGLQKVFVFVKGIGAGRDSAIRSLATHGLEISAIRDITPIPHNGCRPKKARRV